MSKRIDVHPTFNKFLREDQVLPQLRAGRSIQQWLSVTLQDDYRTITYLTIEPSRSGDFHIRWSESFDEGNSDFGDVEEFSAVDEDLNAQRNTHHPTAEEAVAVAIRDYGAHPDRFVGSGMIQEVYAYFLEEHGEAPNSSRTA